MPRTRWIVLATALVLIAASVLEERTSGGTRAGVTGELVWATGRIDARPGGSSYDVVAAWNQLHPNGPTVRIEALPNAPDDQHQELALRLHDQSKDVDILSLDLVWTSEFAANGWLANLDSMRSRIERVSLPGPVQSAMWDGKLWAAPDVTDAPFLYYNTKYVPQPPPPGSTWDEVVKLGLEAFERHRKENPQLVPFVGEGAQYEGMVVSYLESLRDGEGNLFNADCTSVVFKEDAALEALNFMRRAREIGFYSPDIDHMKEEEARQAFQAGNAVFMRNWPYAYDLMKNPKPGDRSEVARNIGIMPMPTFTGKGKTGMLGGHNLAVNRFSDNIEAAKDFVLFVSTTRDIQHMLAQKHSMAPTMRSVYEDLHGDPVMNWLDQILPNTTQRPSTREWNEISEKIQELIWPAYKGQSDSTTAVRELRRFLVTKLATGGGCTRDRATGRQ